MGREGPREEVVGAPKERMDGTIPAYRTPSSRKIVCRHLSPSRLKFRTGRDDETLGRDTCPGTWGGSDKNVDTLYNDSMTLQLLLDDTGYWPFSGPCIILESFTVDVHTKNR